VGVLKELKRTKREKYFQRKETRLRAKTSKNIATKKKKTVSLVQKGEGKKPMTDRTKRKGIKKKQPRGRSARVQKRIKRGITYIKHKRSEKKKKKEEFYPSKAAGVAGKGDLKRKTLWVSLLRPGTPSKMHRASCNPWKCQRREEGNDRENWGTKKAENKTKTGIQKEKGDNLTEVPRRTSGPVNKKKKQSPDNKRA